MIPTMSLPFSREGTLRRGPSQRTAYHRGEGNARRWRCYNDTPILRRDFLMHDIKWIRDNPEAFDKALARRGLNGEAQRLIAIDGRRRAAIQKAEAALARRNAASKEIGAAKKSGEEDVAQKLMAEVARLKEDTPKLEAEAKAASEELDKALAGIPNLPLDEVPDGADETGNVEHHHFGAKRNYAFAPKQHFDL